MMIRAFRKKSKLSSIMFIFIGLYSYSCTSRLTKNDHYAYENIAYECLIYEFNKVGINLEERLELIESSLISSEVLNGKTGKDYEQLFQHLTVGPNELKINSFEHDTVLFDYQGRFHKTNLVSQCIWMNEGDSVFFNSSSKLAKLQTRFSDVPIGRYRSLKEEAEIILRELDSDDFEHPFYRAYCLLRWNWILFILPDKGIRRLPNE